jgi:hypothetical protein
MLRMADGKGLSAMAERGMGLKYHNGIGGGGCRGRRGRARRARYQQGREVGTMRDAL